MRQGLGEKEPKGGGREKYKHCEREPETQNEKAGKKILLLC